MLASSAVGSSSVTGGEGKIVLIFLHRRPLASGLEYISLDLCSYLELETSQVPRLSGK